MEAELEILAWSSAESLHHLKVLFTLGMEVLSQGCVWGERERGKKDDNAEDRRDHPLVMP